MKKIVKERNDIAFYIILYPLPSHKEAYGKSKAIYCEKSLEMLEDAFQGKPLPKPSCQTSVIDENIKLANKLGVRGTPAIILPDGVMMGGYRDAQSLIKLIDKK